MYEEERGRLAERLWGVFGIGIFLIWQLKKGGSRVSYDSQSPFYLFTLSDSFVNRVGYESFVLMVYVVVCCWTSQIIYSVRSLTSLIAPLPQCFDSHP